MFTRAAPVPRRYLPIIRTGAKAAGAVGLPGAFSFGLDVAAMSGIWTTMTIAIARESGHDIDRPFAAKLVSAIIAGIAGYVGGSKLATTLLHLIPGAGTLAAVGVNGFLDFLYTWRLGVALARLFDKDDFAGRDVRAIAFDIVKILTPAPSHRELLEIITVLRAMPTADEAATIAREW